MSDLAQRILTKLAKASSKRPARAADVAALVGGPEPDFWRALEQLVGSRQVATAHIQKLPRDPEPWLAIWPTGLHAPAGGWTGNSHSCLFVPTTPTHEALHAAQAPRVRAVVAPEPASVRAGEPLPACPEKSPVQRAILAATRGLPQSQALCVPDLAKRIGIKDTSIQSSLLKLERAGKIAICKFEQPNARGAMRPIRVVYDPSASSVEAA